MKKFYLFLTVLICFSTMLLASDIPKEYEQAHLSILNQINNNSQTLITEKINNFKGEKAIDYEDSGTIQSEYGGTVNYEIAGSIDYEEGIFSKNVTLNYENWVTYDDFTLNGIVTNELSGSFEYNPYSLEYSGIYAGNLIVEGLWSGSYDFEYTYTLSYDSITGDVITDIDGYFNINENKIFKVKETFRKNKISKLKTNITNSNSIVSNKIILKNFKKYLPRLKKEKTTHFDIEDSGTIQSEYGGICNYSNIGWMEINDDYVSGSFSYDIVLEYEDWVNADGTIVNGTVTNATSGNFTSTYYSHQGTYTGDLAVTGEWSGTIVFEYTYSAEYDSETNTATETIDGYTTINGDEKQPVNRKVVNFIR